MKIECPECKLTGTIDDSTVPATGLAMNCPRCKARFTVERPAAGSASAGAMLDSCPSCQYATFSEEKFAVCPRCGLVVADYFRSRLGEKQGEKLSQGRTQEKVSREQAPPPVKLSTEQLRKEEEARKRYGLDKLPGQPEDAAEPKMSPAETPLPVLIVGWATVIVALVLLVYGGSGIFEFLGKLNDAQAALQAGEEAATTGSLFLGFAFFPVLIILYSLAMLVFGSQFLNLRLWAVKALGTGAWVGIALAAVMELADMIAWCRRASSGASIGYYATGLFGGVLLAALWIIPLLILKAYFNSVEFGQIEDHFS